MTAGEMIAREQKLMDKYHGDLSKIEAGTYQYDGSMPEVCIKPMYLSFIVGLTEGIEYLKGFDLEHELTDDELFKHRLIVNGTPNY